MSATTLQAPSGRGLKDDQHALRQWGAAYDAIPKSVFATVAWHLANLASGEADADGAAEAMFRAELGALIDAGIIPSGQGKRADAAIAKLGGR